MDKSKIDKTEISEHIHTQNPEIIKKIISKLDDQNIQVRGEAFYSLFLNENDISDILIDGLNSESNNIKGFSSLILANRGDSNAIPHVERLIQDTSSMVRSYALGALAHLNAQQSISLIRNCFDDKKIEVRKNAVQAFFKIEGKIFDNEIEKLRENADEELIVDVSLASETIQMQTYVVTASRKRERVEDAPAAISVITEKDIRRESNTNLGDYMKAVKGVEFTQSGIDSYNLSARGFNSSFSSRLLTLTDGRMANVPSLRLTAYNVIPVSFEDVEQIEVVLGPSSALYGPNAHSGVLNIVTRAPRDSKGTVFNVQTGYLSQKNSKPLQKITFNHYA